MMQENKVKFSIIVPVYNCEKYINKLVESILNQAYKNFEIILVNDGSTDGSLEVCTKLSEENANIQVINKVNTGVSDTRNVGMKKASGEYILFLDADDYIDNNYFEYIIKILEEYNYNIDLINTGIYTEIQKDGQTYVDKMKYITKYYNSQEEIREDLVNLWDTHMLYNPVNKVYSRAVIEKNNLTFPDLYFGEDMVFNMKYVDCIKTFYNSEECFYHYIREREGAATEKYDPNLFKIRENEYIEFNKYFEEHGIKFEKYIEFSSRRFIERVVGCAENICRSSLSSKEKKQNIKFMMNNENVKQALQYAKLKSKKMKLLVLPLRVKSANMLFYMSKFIGFVKKFNPALFYKLKNRR